MPRKTIKLPKQVGHSTVEPAVNYRQAHAALLALANPNKAEFLAGFFKTGKGQYAEGDRFLGITVPAIRQLSRQLGQLGLTDCERLLQSAYNDERLLSLLILVEQYRKGDVGVKNKVYQIYLKTGTGLTIGIWWTVRFPTSSGRICSSETDHCFMNWRNPVHSGMGELAFSPR